MRRAASVPRHRCGKTRESKATVRQLSLREVYLNACAEHNVRANSGVCAMLSGRADTTLPTTVLNVSSNYLGDRGVVALANVVDAMPSLQRLVLTYNGLRNRGVHCVCRVAARHPALTSIDLSDNYISEGAAVSLAALLRDNVRIVDVAIENTAIDVAWRVRLHDMMAANRSIARSADCCGGDTTTSAAHKTQAYVAVDV